MSYKKGPVPKSGARLIAAIVISALTVVPLYMMLAFSTGDYYSVLLLPALIAATVLAFMGILIVGLPLHFYLTARGMTGPINYAAPGFFAPFMLVVLTKPFGLDGLVFVFLQASLLGLFGISVALVFRCIALGGRSLTASFDNQEMNDRR